MAASHIGVATNYNTIPRRGITPICHHGVSGPRELAVDGELAHISTVEARCISTRALSDFMGPCSQGGRSGIMGVKLGVK